MLVGNHNRRTCDSQLEVQLQWQTIYKAFNTLSSCILSMPLCTWHCCCNTLPSALLLSQYATNCLIFSVAGDARMLRKAEINRVNTMADQMELIKSQTRGQ